MTENAFERFHALGYTRLIPIVPPTAEISEHSTLFKRIGTRQDGRGKTPGTRGRDGKWTSFDWAAYEADTDDLARWAKMGAGVGIKTGGQLIAIDADTLQKPFAAIIRDTVEKHFGRTPIRVGQFPKALYLLRVSEPVPYMRVEFGPRNEHGNAERVELLTEGRQFVAEGVHPKTGQPYTWPRPLVPFDELPIATPATLEAFWADLRAALPEASKLITEGGTKPVDQAALTGSLDAVTKAITALPNTSNHFPSRESYRDVGYAIKAALPHNEPEALALFQDWCARWTDGENDPDVVEADWRRMKPPYRRGASWLYEIAEEHGHFDRAEAWFEPIDEAALAPNPFQEIAAQSAKEPLPPIKWARPSDWAGQTPKPREWEVEGWIPRFEVVLLYGAGGIGKTLAIHQYATAAAAGRSWLGQPTRQAKVMCFFCEDSEDELLRRQIDINRALGIEFAEIDERLRIASRKYMDNLLALWDRNTGAMKRQAVWEQLRADAVEFGAEVLVIDTIADTYGGNEIDRGQVNAFVKSCLGRLAQEIGGTVIALGHPSMSGMASGQGTSGSTAWSNAARSRLFLRYPKGVEKGNVRELEGMKLNYGPKGNLLKLRWRAGAFDVIAATVAPSGDDSLPKPFKGSGSDGAGSGPVGVEDACDAAVLDALVAVGPAAMVLKPTSINYAPKVLKRREPDLLVAFGADEIEGAILRLEARGAIVACEVGRDASRRPVQGFQVVSDTGVFQ